MKEMVVFAHLLKRDDPEFYPRVLLRSKMIPELEEQIKSVMDKDNIKPDETDWEAKVRVQSSLIKTAVEILDDLRQELSFAIAGRKIDDNDGELREVLMFMNSGILPALPPTAISLAL